MARPAAGVLSKDMLSWEPVRMVTPKLKQEMISTGFTMATLELSALDMLFEDEYGSVVLFYEARQASTHDEIKGPEEAARRLHAALEELLVHYPCAAGLLMHNDTHGRLEVRYRVYNTAISTATATSAAAAGAAAAFDEIATLSTYGVRFHVAHATNATLSDLGDLSNPNPSLDVLFPGKPCTQSSSDPRFLMAFQVTTFKCGGFSVAHLCSHVYADGYTAAAFMQKLCSIARAGDANLAIPLPSRRVVLRAREPPTPTIPHLDKVFQTRKRSEPPCSLKHQLHYVGTATRFVFPLDSLEALRVHILSAGHIKECSRNQALMALLWTAHARVRLAVHALPGSHETVLRFPVNLRSRGIPNITKGSMGNAIFFCTVVATLNELCESPLGYVVEKIKSTVAGLHLVECAQSMVDYLELQLRDGLIASKVGLRMPSLVGLPFYDTDCGWGRPTYVGRPSKQLSEGYTILDHPTALAWNVLTVFRSTEEHSCFQESVAAYISPNDLCGDFSQPFISAPEPQEQKKLTPAPAPAQQSLSIA